MKRIDKFVNDTSIIWFLVLISAYDIVGWLVGWAAYEIIMSIFLTDEEENEEKKRKEKIKPKNKKLKRPPRGSSNCGKEAETQNNKTEKVYI